jgi:hypothetical protein
MRPVESWGASPRLSPSGWPNCRPGPAPPALTGDNPRSDRAQTQRRLGC